MGITEFMALATYCAVASNSFDGGLARHLGMGGFWKAGEAVIQNVTRAFGPAAVDLVSGDRAWFTRQFADGSVLALPSFLPFQQRPYYRTESGSMIPIHDRLMQEKVAIGPFWMLHEATRRPGGRGVRAVMGDVGLVVGLSPAVALCRDAQRFTGTGSTPSCASHCAGCAGGEHAVRHVAPCSDREQR